MASVIIPALELTTISSSDPSVGLTAEELGSDREHFVRYFDCLDYLCCSLDQLAADLDIIAVSSEVYALRLSHISMRTCTTGVSQEIQDKIASHEGRMITLSAFWEKWKTELFKFSEHAREHYEKQCSYLEHLPQAEELSSSSSQPSPTTAGPSFTGHSVESVSQMPLGPLALPFIHNFGVALYLGLSPPPSPPRVN